MRQTIIKLHAERRSGTHPGLMLQRYLVQQSDPVERRTLLDTVRGAARSKSLRSVYVEAFQRWDRSFAGDKPFRSVRLATAGRLIVGLGSESVLETGLRLHHTYGVPIIPGSALKGLASHYCHEVWGQRHNALAPEENTLFRRGERYHGLLYGSTEDGGVITFHDAWIVPESLDDGALRLDVMTPHHPKWQTSGAPPTDFDSPNPVSFLSVAGMFDVCLSWSGPVDAPREKAEAWTGVAMQILREALAEWGVGGKTSSGYGRLVTAEALADAPRQPSQAAPAKAKALPRSGDRVEAQLLEGRTRKGGWRALHRPSGLAGDIQNSAAVPSDKKPGDMLEVFVAFANQQQIAFRYPTPEEEARRVASNRRGGPGKSGRRR